MRILLSSETIAATPDWIQTFIDAAWTAPDRDGQRAVESRLDRDVANDVAERVTKAMNSRKTDFVFHFALNDQGGKFDLATFWKDRWPSVAHDLALVWSERRAIAECGTCGALMLPSKGRTARYCSDNCRIAAHRKGN